MPKVHTRGSFLCLLINHRETPYASAKRKTKFDSITTKLCTDVTLVKPVTKHIMIGDGLDLATKEDDAIAGGYQRTGTLVG